MTVEKSLDSADIYISQAVVVDEITAREAREDERLKSEQQGSGGALEVTTSICVACIRTRASFHTDMLTGRDTSVPFPQSILALFCSALGKRLQLRFNFL